MQSHQAAAGNNPTKRHPYFDIKSSFIGPTPFVVEIPSPLPPAPKLLPFPISREVFTRYRPTPLELSKTALLTESDEGIHVDLVGPAHSTEKQEHGSRQLDARDARLLIDIIPNVEALATQSNKTRVAPGRRAQDAARPEAAANSGRRVVDRIDKQFTSPTAFQHPTKAHLKLVDSYPVLPNVDLWSNRYSQCALEGADQNPFDPHAVQSSSKPSAPYVLQYVDASKTLKRYSLYEGTAAPRATDTHMPDQERTAHSSTLNLDGLYHHIRDYIVENRPSKHAAAGDNHFLLSLPPSMSTTPQQPRAVKDSGQSEPLPSGTGVAFLLPLTASGGRKHIFEKASAKLGSDTRRRKPPLMLTLRELAAEEADTTRQEAKIFTEPPVDDGSQVSSSSASSSSSSASEGLSSSGKSGSSRKPPLQDGSTRKARSRVQKPPKDTETLTGSKSSRQQPKKVLKSDGASRSDAAATAGAGKKGESVKGKGEKREQRRHESEGSDADSGGSRSSSASRSESSGTSSSGRSSGGSSASSASSRYSQASRRKDSSAAGRTRAPPPS